MPRTRAPRYKRARVPSAHRDPGIGAARPCRRAVPSHVRSTARSTKYRGLVIGGYALWTPRETPGAMDGSYKLEVRIVDAAIDLWSDGYTLVFTRATRYTGRGDTPKRQAPTDKTAHSNTSARGDIMCSRRTGAVSSDLSSLITPPPWPCVLRRAQASHACCAWRAAR